MYMTHFTPEEFRGFYDKMDERLLHILDQFRSHWGAPVIISPAEGAIGRTYGKGFHNYARHGKIMAIDVMPRGFNGPDDFRRAVAILTELGALGIGIYPDWKPSPGLHIDVGDRSNRSIGNPATWSAFSDGPNGKQMYYGIERSFK